MVMLSGKKNKSYKSLPEDKLISKSGRGDTLAFDELIYRNKDYIKSTIFSFSKGRYDDDELEQKAMIKCWRNIKNFRGDCKFTTWMYRILRNICYDEYRKSKRSKEVSFDGLLETQEDGLGWFEKRMPVTDPIRAKKIDIAFLKKVLNQSVVKMSDNHVEVLRLFAEEDLSYVEIAKKMKCSVGTVMSRLFYARKQAQRHYKSEMARISSLTEEV